VNPYYILGMIALSVMMYAALVSLLTLTGISIVTAMFFVYATMAVFMVAMQRRAVQAFLPNSERRRKPGIPLTEGSLALSANNYIADLVEQPVSVANSSTSNPVVMSVSDVLPKRVRMGR